MGMQVKTYKNINHGDTAKINGYTYMYLDKVPKWWEERQKADKKLAEKFGRPWFPRLFTPCSYFPVFGIKGKKLIFENMKSNEK